MFREILLPAAVIGALATMVLPLPFWLLDLLIVANLLVAVSLLFAALYVADPVRLSVLPSVLLLTTLGRLALNVSTTRQILTFGEAGMAIETFGALVLQGNVVVGIVVFSMIALIQFVVVAKGAERVAEVTARFTLDALPGKQMSIDADLRAGLLDVEAARRRRSELQVESRFFGALDGAMKFIKGDAIAGIAITLVNIVGGLVTGLAMRGMGIASALRQYTMLALGDALVSQLPSLLNALAAGIVVTRVTTGGTLSSEICRQFGQIERIRGLSVVAALLIGSVPGMPFMICLFLAAAIVAMPSVRPSEEPEMPQFRPSLPRLLSVAIEAEDSRRFLGSSLLVTRMERLREELFEAHGLLLPPPIFETHAESGYEIRLRGVKIAKGELLQSTEASIETIASALGAWCREHRIELIDDLMTRRLVDRLEAESPELCSAVLPTLVTLTQLTEILRGLSAERVSIRNLGSIFQAIAEAVPRVGISRALMAEIRHALRRSISAEISGGSGRLRCYTLAPLADHRIAAAEAGGAEPDEDLTDGLAAAVASGPEGRRVLLCSKSSRLRLKEMLTSRGIDADVLAYSEICDGVELIVEGTLEAYDNVESEAKLAA